MNTQVNTLNLYQRMLNVANEVMNVEKNMKVGTGNNSYKAVADYDVVVAVKKAEKNHGVISIPVCEEVVDSKVVETVSVYNNQEQKKVQYVDVLKVTTRFINVDNPSESVEVCAFGRGIDTADKGFGKASTYARKYCLLNAYKIATGEDPDKDASPVYEEKPSNNQKPQSAPAAPAPVAPAPAADPIAQTNLAALIAKMKTFTNAADAKKFYMEQNLTGNDRTALKDVLMSLPCVVEVMANKN